MPYFFHFFPHPQFFTKFQADVETAQELNGWLQLSFSAHKVIVWAAIVKLVDSEGRGGVYQSRTLTRVRPLPTPQQPHWLHIGGVAKHAPVSQNTVMRMLMVRDRTGSTHQGF